MDIKTRNSKEKVKTEADLIQYLKEFLDRNIDFSELEDSFYMLFMDDYEEDGKFESQFSEICERMDFTTENPPKEDRKDGYKSSEEFRDWLTSFLLKQELFN